MKKACYIENFAIPVITNSLYRIWLWQIESTGPQDFAIIKFYFIIVLESGGYMLLSAKSIFKNDAQYWEGSQLGLVDFKTIAWYFTLSSCFAYSIDSIRWPCFKWTCFRSRPNSRSNLNTFNIMFNLRLLLLSAFSWLCVDR